MADDQQHIRPQHKPVGPDYLTYGYLNKGQAFTIEERKKLGINGLFPPKVRTKEEQFEICKLRVDRYPEFLEKYIYLIGLQAKQEKLFYSFLLENLKELLTIIYIPTVGLACQKYSIIYNWQCGLFFTYHDSGKIQEIFNNWPESDVKVILVTDGGSVNGLGDLGANAMAMVHSKAILCTLFGGIKPHNCLPVVIDCGTDNESSLRDPFYIGLREKRLPTETTSDFFDEFMKEAVSRYGLNTIIHFTNFGSNHAFSLWKKYSSKYCCINDNIFGLGAVTVALLITSEQLTKIPITDLKILFFGSGKTAIGSAKLVMRAVVNRGVPKENAADNIWLIDANGLVVKSRRKLPEWQKPFAHDLPPMVSLLETIETIKPNALIGTADVLKAFTSEVIKLMAKLNERPLIIVLSHLLSRAECTAMEAYTHSQGRAIYAGKSVDKIIEYEKQLYHPAWCSSLIITPGVTLGVIASQIHFIPQELFLIAAQTLSESVTEEDLQKGSLLPPVTRIQEVSIKIASNIMNYVYETGLSTQPEPKDKLELIKSLLYNFY